MNKYVKTILYFASIVCPLADIFKGIISGISKSLETAEQDIQRLKQVKVEELIAHKSVLNQQKFEEDNK